MKMEQTVCYETSAYKIQTPGNYPEEKIQHTEHGECLKSRIILLCLEVSIYCIHSVILFLFSDYRHTPTVQYVSGASQILYKSELSMWTLYEYVCTYTHTHQNVYLPKQ
jgi:hypothetical protein